MEKLDLIMIREKVERSLPRNESVVSRTSGICEWAGKYDSCGDCNGIKLRCDSYIGRNYSE